MNRSVRYPRSFGFVEPFEGDDRNRTGGAFRSCWLARFSEEPCDGRLIRAHLIPRQRIVREVAKSLPREEAFQVIWDERVWVPACGGPMGNAGHHGAFDGKHLYVPRWALPEGVEDYAREYGLGWSLDRDYGLIEDVVA